MEILQLIANGVMAGSILAVPAIGLTAMYAVLRFPNFAIASHATAGAFAGWTANALFGLPILPSLLVALLVGGLIGLVTDEFVLKPFRKAGFITTAIGSLALTIGLENVVRLFYGNDLRGYDLPLARDIVVAGIHVGPQQLHNIAISVAIMALVFGFLTFTRMGKAMRAVADNPQLADIKGIDARTVGRIVSFMGMGLAGIGGMLIGLDSSIDPMTGFRAMLPIFAAAVVGGLGSVPGAVVGALVVGIAEELSLLALPASYKSSIAFLAILVILTLRPQGILGREGN
ncbi:branched-chain amino acid ABC transporter permease [Bosea sp. (in: a-proteobacteria)]|uniref:branched-chain amino acid ABC transporter permease n=1 Tax=Bosea sp. (in: a-proteobacteria) TaxID=1871050 RepID=UPI00262F7D3A|nr:branched-chain amino acid ABC transporter permease [Bosea sp. (in: a-proteobacteria)]MCO5093167.1 branched-chain amino acid ABC transporter permease [Bosea sp. (in: a-proteobacteria)]